MTAACSIAWVEGMARAGIGNGVSTALPLAPGDVSRNNQRSDLAGRRTRSDVASAASRPTSDADDEVRSHFEYGRPMPSMSEVSGVS